MTAIYKTSLVLGASLSLVLGCGFGAVPQVYLFSTVAGINADRSGGHTDASGTNATFSYPDGVVIDKSWAADYALQSPPGARQRIIGVIWADVSSAETIFS